jgi:oxaloacetate decarboxylase alpha subunit
VEELRQEIGPELSDDDLILKILIPGTPLPQTKPKAHPRAPVKMSGTSPAAPAGPAPDFSSFPRKFSVDVDGEVFNVSVSPVRDEPERVAAAEQPAQAKELPDGAVVSDMAGLVLSVEVKVGDPVRKGDLVAMIEAMKMRRHVLSPRDGVVREIWAKEGEVVDIGDVLMVVA